MQHLSTIPGVVEVPAFSPEANKILDELATGFTVEDAAKVKDVERVTNHDVKAVEYVLKDKIKGCQELERVLEFVHFACTSEDINNLSHGMMLKEGVNEMLKEMDKVIEEISRYVVAGRPHRLLLETGDGEYDGILWRAMMCSTNQT